MSYKVKAWFQVSRPPLAVMGFLGPLAVASQLNNLFQLKTFILTLMIGLINLGSLYLNEFCDIETDRILKPKKPLPSGRLKPKSVLQVGLASIFFGVLMLIAYQLYFPDSLLFIFSLTALLFSIIYNVRGKTLRTFGLPSMIIPIVLAPTVIYQSYGKLGEGLNFVLGLGFWWYAQGLATQYQDIPADKAAGLKTDAILIGKFSWILVSVTSILSALFFVNSFLTFYAKISILIGISLVFITSPFLVLDSNKKFVQRIIEVFCRLLARLSLLTSFICMVLVI